MTSKTRFVGGERKAVGHNTQELLETLELAFVHLCKLNDRVKTLESA